jgi:hypothetical protein
MKNQDEHNKRIRKHFHELANNPDAKNQTAMQQLVNFLRMQRTIDLTEDWRIFSEDIEAAIQEFYMDIEKQQQGYTKDDIIKAYWKRTDDIDVDGYWIENPEKDIQNLIKHL